MVAVPADGGGHPVGARAARRGLRVERQPARRPDRRRAGPGVLAGGELAMREHFSGYRSHTTLIAGLTGFLAGALLVALGVPKGVVLLAAVAVGVAAFPFLRRAFKRRSGGLGFRA